jgi:choline kinase
MPTGPKGIILAAGRGKRMGASTDEMPKCLLTVGGRRLLDWQLDSMRAGGITEIAIVTGYRSELIANEDVSIFHNNEWKTSDMVSSLACATEWLSVSTCLVSYSDIFYQSTAIEALRASTADLAVTYDPNWLALWSQRFVDPLADAESFRLDNEGFLTEIGRSADSVHVIQGQYMGLLRFTPVGWRTFEEATSTFGSEGSTTLHMTAVLQRIVEMNSVRIRAIEYDDPWGEIDSPSDLALFGGG